MTQVWEILVPTIRNDGAPVRTRYHRVWDEKVRKITNGLTVLPVANGQWVSDDGSLFKERMIPVQIMCSRDQIKEIAEMTIDHYEQLAVFVKKISDEGMIITADNQTKASWPIKQKFGNIDYSWLVDSSSDETDSA